MSPQKWIDRYVAEVGRMLPERKRADVEKEIRVVAIVLVVNVLEAVQQIYRLWRSRARAGAAVASQSVL